MADRCLGGLLAGGSARRFGGRPKGLATINGVRIAQLALAALHASTTTQLVVANDPAAGSWFPTERVARDITPDAGPLAGIEAALAAAGGEPVIVVAWDMPFVPAALLTELRRRALAGVDAVVPRVGARTEPLCAWYAPSALIACRTLLRAGERRAGALADALPHVEWMTEVEIEPFGRPDRLFTSVDTPEGLASLGGAPP